MNEPVKQPLRGPNILIEGPAGTGKTYSTGTLVDAGMEVFFFAFEAGVESLLGYWADRGKPIPANLHIITVQLPTASWSEMADAVHLVNTLGYDSLKKAVDPHRSKYNQLEKFLRTFNDVQDDTGKKWGAIDTWGPDRAIVIDGLTGLSHATMQAVIGGKADRDQKDWGLAQNILENLLRKLCDGVQAMFVLYGHVERETDLVYGGTKIMVSTLGRALPPKIPPMFSDVILAVRVGNKFTWDTANGQADLKTRNLPIGVDIPQDFGQIIKKWRGRGGVTNG